jgi:hypothetical protein
MLTQMLALGEGESSNRILFLSGLFGFFLEIDQVSSSSSSGRLTPLSGLQSNTSMRLFSGISKGIDSVSRRTATWWEPISGVWKLVLSSGEVLGNSGIGNK